VPDVLKQPLGKRARMRDSLQDTFEAQVTRLAGFLERTQNIRAWHQAMHTAVIEHLAQQAALGAGRHLKKSEVKHVGEAIIEHSAYLSRFADEVAAKRLIGKPLSSTQIAARASQYSGAGRGLWYRMSEQAAGEDVVIVYRARDDDRTCPECLEAARNSPYASGAGPMPGATCRGRSRCRCTREVRHDKRLAKQLRKAA
jgi:hypothetical protein